MGSSTPAAVSPSAATEDQQHQHYDQDYEPNTHSNSLLSGRARGLAGLIRMLCVLMLRPLVCPLARLIGSVSVLLLQFAHKAILFAPDLLKLVVAKLAPLFPGHAFQ